MHMVSEINLILEKLVSLLFQMHLSPPIFLSPSLSLSPPRLLPIESFHLGFLVKSEN